jgi:hypothetical protein
MMKPLLSRCFLLSTLLAACLGPIAPVRAQASAPIYMCTDEFNRRSFTNVPAEMKGHKCVKQVETGLPAPSVRPAAKGASSPSPADFPRIGSNDQKARDEMRRKVLTEELASEQKQLDKANQDLNDARAPRPGENRSSPGYLERVGDAEKASQRHRANVESLQREIGNLK